MTILALAAFSGCGKTESATAAGFNTGDWMEDETNATQFQYIAVYDDDAYFAVDEADQQWILDTLKDVSFAPAEEAGDMRPDFATPVVPNPEPYTVHITVFKPLAGPPELSDIEKIQ